MWYDYSKFPFMVTITVFHASTSFILIRLYPFCRSNFVNMFCVGQVWLLLTVPCQQTKKKKLVFKLLEFILKFCLRRDGCLSYTPAELAIAFSGQRFPGHTLIRLLQHIVGSLHPLPGTRSLDNPSQNYDPKCLPHLRGD